MSKKKKLKVNFEGVETRVLVPEGQYHAKVAEVTEEKGNEFPYLKWMFAVVSDDNTNGAKLYYNTSLSPKALWNLRNLLQTLGVETPDDEYELDLESYAGLELMVRVEHETYEGKDRAKVTDFTVIEETAETEDDEKPKKPKKGEEEEVEEEETDDDEEETDDDEEETDDDDGKLTVADVGEMDDAELDDLNKKHKLKLDRATFKKRSKYLAAIQDALEKKDLIK